MRTKGKCGLSPSRLRKKAGTERKKKGWTRELETAYIFGDQLGSEQAGSGLKGVGGKRKERRHRDGFEWKDRSKGGKGYWMEGGFSPSTADGRAMNEGE